jgi:MFS family permease
MDSVIYALVLAPALTELLPRSGMEVTPARVGYVGSVMFALFLVGWGCAFLWGPIADRFGRTKALAATILVYALFTGASAFAQNVWELGAFRLLAGIGVGGEWAMAGTYVAESWPEDRRTMGAGFLQTGYYFGFFVAAALNYTVGARYGWRAMFLCGLVPVVVAVLTLFKVQEPPRWKAHEEEAKHSHPLVEVFSAKYRKRTIVNAALLSVAIIGLWAGAVYEPAAITTLAKKAGMDAPEAAKMVSLGTSVLSLGTILGCLAVPLFAERFGRKRTLALFWSGMMIAIPLAFGWAFYLEHGLAPFIGALFLLGFAGGNFTVFSIWLPEQYETRVRATAFAFCTSVGRFLGAGVNFALGAIVLRVGTLGMPIAWTGAAFALGILIVPFALETKGQRLPG